MEAWGRKPDQSMLNQKALLQRWLLHQLVIRFSFLKIVIYLAQMGGFFVFCSFFLGQ